MTRTYETDLEWYSVAESILSPSNTNGMIENPPVHDIESRRYNATRFYSLLFPEVPLAVNVETLEHEITTFDGLQIRIYEIRSSTLDTPKPSPAVVYAHGGGMISLDAKTTLNQAASMAASSNTTFFSVDYRLAPEYPFPGPMEDVYSALVWLQKNSSWLNVDPSRIALAGESAGGGIAAGVALMARDRKLNPPLAKQLLFYPMLDHRTATADPQLHPYLTWGPTDNITGWSALLGRDVSKESVDDIRGLQYASPSRATSLEDLPAMYIDTGDLDLFYDEIVSYAERFSKENGKHLDFHVFHGIPHGFNGLARNSRIVKRALRSRNAAIRELWDK